MGYGRQEVLTIVAVEGSADDWAAYAGTGTTQEVAEKGHKLPKVIAEALFPHWAERLAWRY